MSSWAKETIGKTVKLQGGYAFKSSRFSDSGVPVIRIGNVQNDVIDIDSAVRHESIDISESFTIQLNDILIAMSGATTGKIGVYKHNTLSYLNQRVGKFVITDKRRMSFGYLYQFLRSHRFQFQLNTLTGQSAQPNISSTQIESLAITLPPLPEQKAIAALLSTWDEAIEKTERLIQAKEKQLNGLYQHYFVPESSSNMHWEKVKIGRVLKQRSKKALPSDDRPLFSLTIEDGVTAKTDRYNREALVKDNGSKKYKIVCPNDIVFNPANLRWGAIARSTVPHEVVISPIYEVLSVKNDAVDIDFISHLLTCPRQIGIYATKTEGTLIERMAVKLDAFLLLDIYLPPEREEQQEISNILNAAQHEIDLLKQLADKYKTQKRGLMQKMLTGKWRVKPKIVNQYMEA